MGSWQLGLLSLAVVVGGIQGVATGGYSVFHVLFPQAHRAVAVVADTSRLRDTERVAVGLARWLALGTRER